MRVSWPSVHCPRPNCDHIFCQVKAVRNCGRSKRICRVVENFRGVRTLMIKSFGARWGEKPENGQLVFVQRPPNSPCKKCCRVRSQFGKITPTIRSERGKEHFGFCTGGCGTNDVSLRFRRESAANDRPDQRPNDGHVELRESADALPISYRRAGDVSVQCG